MKHAVRIRFLLVVVVLVILLFADANDNNDTPEILFRRASQAWRSSRDAAHQYQPWVDFSIDIWNRFHEQSSARLDWIGALEESILLIEKTTLQEGENRPRDVALAKLYAVYGHALMELNPQECRRLELDPHTLLIGADPHAEKQPLTNHLCVENAENSLRNAVTLDATHQQAQELLENLLQGSGDTIHTRKPKEFVAELFDSFADTFDEKLLKGLQYKVPQLVGEVVQSLRRPNSQYTHALDAGCGTGLAGRFLRPQVSQTLMGVDASQKMLDIAAKCTLSFGCGVEQADPTKSGHDGNNEEAPLYDGLLVMDLESMTVANTLHQVESSPQASGFDLIVAADVLVYFGSLENLLGTFAKVSVPGAILVFSCERTTKEEAPLGWRLLPSGRFAHTKEHVQEAARKAGYQLQIYKEIVPRMEKGQEVQGHLFGYEWQDGSAHSEL